MGYGDGRACGRPTALRRRRSSRAPAPARRTTDRRLTTLSSEVPVLPANVFVRAGEVLSSNCRTFRRCMTWRCCPTCQKTQCILGLGAGFGCVDKDPLTIIAGELECFVAQGEIADDRMMQ